MGKLTKKIEKKYLKGLNIGNYAVYYSQLANISNDSNNYAIRPCFSAILWKNENTDFIKIKINRIHQESQNHICFFSDYEIKKFLDTINIIFGGIDRYTISKDNVEIWVDMTKTRAKDNINKAHRLTIYSAIRYLFESPYSLILKKAFILKKELKHKHLINLLMIAHYQESFAHGHCLMEPPESIKHERIDGEYKTIVENRLQKINIRRFINYRGASNNQLFKTMPRYSDDETQKIIKIIKKYDNEKDTSNW